MQVTIHTMFVNEKINRIYSFWQMHFNRSIVTKNPLKPHLKYPTVPPPPNFLVESVGVDDRVLYLDVEHLLRVPGSSHPGLHYSLHLHQEGTIQYQSINSVNIYIWDALGFWNLQSCFLFILNLNPLAKKCLNDQKAKYLCLLSDNCDRKPHSQVQNFYITVLTQYT